MSEAEALNLALAQARDEIDVAAEEARRKAREREAFEALIASLRKDKADASTTIDEQTQRLEELTTQLSEAEAAKLVSAAAAEELRKRLENSNAELTAMTLALEEQRKKAEDTLTLLAAANGKDSVEKKLQEALSQLAQWTANKPNVWKVLKRHEKRQIKRFSGYKSRLRVAAASG